MTEDEYFNYSQIIDEVEEEHLAGLTVQQVLDVAGLLVQRVYIVALSQTPDATKGDKAQTKRTFVTYLRKLLDIGDEYAKEYLRQASADQPPASRLH